LFIKLRLIFGERRAGLVNQALHDGALRTLPPSSHVNAVLSRQILSLNRMQSIVA
jgi:hypothetical protein